MKREALKFLVFADFHYSKNGYPSTIAQLEQILARGEREKVDLVLHAGDFANNYKASPEATRALLQNKYGFEVAGVAGNHELEGENTWDYVIPRLSNIKDRVFGNGTGDPTDEAAWYYYFDRRGYRFVCLDSTYSYNEAEDVWERNKGFRKREENINGMSIGPAQRAWLERVLDDAADRALSCIVVTHFSICPTYRSHNFDHREVLDIFKRVNEKRKGTVLMAINGHHHSNFVDVVENVLYFNVNTTGNGLWQPVSEPHYEDSATFDFVEYDEEGNPQRSYKRPYTDLRGSAKTWYFKDPLSAVVTVTPDNEITIDGMETEWLFGIEPPRKHAQVMPRISSGVFRPVEQEAKVDEV